MSNLCNVCKHDNRSGNKYCTQCGSKIETAPGNVFRLVALNGKYRGKIFPLVNGENTIGRELDNSIVLVDKQISKHHALVYSDNGTSWIKDVDSRNGIYLNGRRIKGENKLLEGSLIKLGTTILRFELFRKQ